MSVTELQRTIAKLPADQRRTVARFVSRLTKSRTPQRRRQLTSLMKEMDAGKKFSRSEVMKARAAFQRGPI